MPTKQNFSLTLNDDNLIVYFDSEEAWNEYKKKERAAVDSQLRAFWAATTTIERRRKRRFLHDARIKFARDQGLDVRRIRT